MSNNFIKNNVEGKKKDNRELQLKKVLKREL